MKPRAFWKPLDRLEFPILEWVERTRAGGAIEQATAAITKAGEHGLFWYAFAGAAAAADSRRRGRWLAAGGSVAAIYAASIGLKYVARRGRPPIAAIGTESDLSFPSAHAVTSFAAAAIYSELAPQLRPAFYFGALNITGSRLHFCVHYPSDLIAGAAIGQLAGSVVAKRYFAPVPASSEQPAVV